MGRFTGILGASIAVSLTVLNSMLRAARECVLNNTDKEDCMPQEISSMLDTKIVVTSQNRKIITGHAGKCRKFWVYEVADREVTTKNLLELPIE